MPTNIYERHLESKIRIIDFLICYNSCSGWNHKIRNLKLYVKNVIDLLELLIF